MALRTVSDEISLVPWCWGLNGFFSVIGTISAQMLAMTFGSRSVLLCGGVCYAIAWAAITKTAGIESLRTRSRPVEISASL